MIRLSNLLVLLPLLPLAAALWNRVSAWAMSILSVLIMGAAFLSLSDHAAQMILLSQFPFVLLAAGAAVGLARQHASDDDGAPEKEALEQLRQRHAALKRDVVESEKQETQTLQIYGVARGLAEALSWKDMAPRLTAGIQKLFGAYEFLLYAIDEENNWVVLHRRGNWAKEPPVTKELPGQSILLYPPEVSEIVPVLSVPIYMSAGEERRMNGLLFLKCAQAGRNEAELKETGDEVGQQLGIALNKAMLFTKMETHSRLDGLTGALRRQAFMDRLEEEIKRATAFHTPFSLLMVDIDFFKHVNDSHGHAAGDAVLTRVGTVLKECFYETDVVGRYGGEEFIILLPRAEPAGVLRKAESLRQRFESEVILFGFEKLKITVSIGVAHFPEAGRIAETLIARADKALYHAKETGRNRVAAA